MKSLVIGALALWCGIASAQTLVPAPPPHPAPKHPSHVPVVAPRHAGPPRHAAPASKTEVKKPVPAKTPAHRTASKKTAPGKALAAKPVPRKEAAVKPPAPKPVAKPEAPPVAADVGSNTGLHLPRYASLKSDDVNMRVGPAERYPVVWTYKRRELPVRIVREFDIWRLVEDMDGVKGWVHQATLTGRRTFVITGTEDRSLRAEASETADAVAVLKPGVVGRIRSCEAGKDWCQVQVQDYRGWLRRTDFWGTDENEPVAP